MILGQILSIDIIIFLIFLGSQLLIHVGLFQTLYVGIKALPFLVIQLPSGFINEHVFTRRHEQTPFVRQASLFEDVVIRCVRYAFANIPASVGRVFFSKQVALPFMRFRMFRHGYFRCPIHWEEVEHVKLKGLWIIFDPKKVPDVLIYYAHGGGFSMGSAYFYLEFLLSLITALQSHPSKKFNNPAIFALEYTHVPSASHPTQLQETIAGYEYILSKTQQDTSKICISGDSAGATLMLNLSLHIARQTHAPALEDHKTAKAISQLKHLPIPALALFISPWCTLSSPLDHNTPSDFLDAGRLLQYARQFCGPHYALDSSLVSPGNCTDVSLWRKASPEKGIVVLCGREEVFVPQILALEKVWKMAGVRTEVFVKEGGIHAWPVAALFLSSTGEERTKGVKRMAGVVCQRMGDGRAKRGSTG